MNGFEHYIKKYKSFFENMDRKKVFEMGLIFFLMGIIIIIVAGYLSKDNPPIEMDTSNFEQQSEYNKEYDIEGKMKNILSKIKGAGNIDVMVTYETTRERIPVFETRTNENLLEERSGADAGNRESAQKDIDNKVAYEEDVDGNKKPIIQKEVEPEVKGVIVVADGAKDQGVRESLMQAVTVLLDLPVHKIQIFERNEFVSK